MLLPPPSPQWTQMKAVWSGLSPTRPLALKDSPQEGHSLPFWAGTQWGLGVQLSPVWCESPTGSGRG